MICRIAGGKKPPVRVIRSYLLPAAAGILLMSGASGCGTSRNGSVAATGPVIKTVITGVLEESGGPAPGRHQPVSGLVVAVGANHRFMARTDSAGRYRVVVPPGTYVMRGRSSRYQQGHASCVGAKPVTARVGLVTTANVICDVR